MFGYTINALYICVIEFVKPLKKEKKWQDYLKI